MTANLYKPEYLTSRVQQALKCINTTQAPVFLTGNAGTGKTTFLKNLAAHTHKRFIVVAPTGIAALNAGGTTIHSQFLLPFGTFAPNREALPDPFSSGNHYNQHILTRKHPLNSHRKKILRSIDLLVIDEVSMLRADLLDAIDYRLRAARQSYHQPFGGVQVLFIGDLYQLPPVVKREDEALLKSWYPTPWFFEAQCLQRTGMLYIELDKIFRQQDKDFIRILNNLRHNRATAEDYDHLNLHYRPELEINEVKETITLTTHNQQADSINQLALEDLPGKLHRFPARVNGDFPEGMFPVPQILQLKIGCQVMFVKNDPDKKAYFNGRLATVTDISDDGVEVRMHDDGSSLTVTSQTWENKKYEVDSETQEVSEKISGSFEQLPIKLAWAITIHKSQGLTFDKAIIDPGRAFADGQVYVALSRLRSLDGLLLKTRIHQGVVSTDKRIVHFSESRHNPEKLEQDLVKKQTEFAGQQMVSAYDLEPLLKACEPKSLQQENEVPLLIPDFFKKISTEVASQLKTSDRFREQLIQLLHTGEKTQLMERLEKGQSYFSELLWSWLEQVFTMGLTLGSSKGSKTLLRFADEIDHHIMVKISEMERLPRILLSVLDKMELDKVGFEKLEEARIQKRLQLIEKIKSSTQPVEKKSKKKSLKSGSGKAGSYERSIRLFKEGRSIQEIAEERQLVEGTIESHLYRGVSEGKLILNDWISEELQHLYQEKVGKVDPSVSLTELYTITEGRLSYSMLRALKDFLT